MIDVGINRLEKGLVGDVDFASVQPKARLITPVPGGVGPMTIAMLLRNCIDAAELGRGRVVILTALSASETCTRRAAIARRMSRRLLSSSTSTTMLRRAEAGLHAAHARRPLSLPRADPAHPKGEGPPHRSGGPSRVPGRRTRSRKEEDGRDATARRCQPRAPRRVSMPLMMPPESAETLARTPTVMTASTSAYSAIVCPRCGPFRLARRRRSRTGVPPFSLLT